MGLLDGVDWTGRIFTGTWTRGAGPDREAVEPATGQVLATVGQASADDAAEAARHAEKAQRAWAATPVYERAAVLSRAAALLGRHTDEIVDAVLLKPDPRTAVCGGVVIARLFEEAGLPAGVLQMLPGGVEVGSALIDAPAVRVVSFTGSTPAGRAIAAQAARSLTRTHLELGGNSALVVLDDVDVEAAAGCGAFGNFLHSGQVCMAVGRHLVHESIYDDYVSLLAKKADALKVGDGFREDVALGPIIDRKQLGHVRDLVDRSVATGARLVAGGTHEGLFYRPTVLADCTSETPAYREEVFGPVACVRSFADVDEAVELAADSEFGLSLGILTRDLAAGLSIADRVPSGLVHINDQTINDDPGAPFGGVRASGASRVGGPRANIESFTETQWLTMRATPPQYPF